MDARMRKLAILLGDEQLAEKLFEAGLTLPRQVKKATEKDLKAAVGAAGVKKVRRRFPK